MHGEAVDDLLEMLRRSHVRSHDVAVLAGDAVAVDDLDRVLRGPPDVVQPARGRAHADHGAQREAERAWVQAVRAPDDRQAAAVSSRLASAS